MQIVKDTLWLFSAERISVTEIYKKNKLMFYNYSYQIADSSGSWQNRIVWHNFEQKPHYDIFDEGGRLIVHQEQPQTNINDIVKLVQIFRKNLLNMDLAKI